MNGLICSCLDDNYIPLSGLNYEKITTIVNNGGIDAGGETIRKDLKMIQLTWQFYIANEGKRKEILKQTSTGNRYQDYFGLGIRCLLADGVTELEQLKAIISNASREKKESISSSPVKKDIPQKPIPSVVVVDIPEINESIDPVSQHIDEAKNLLTGSCEKFVQIIANIQSEHNLTKQKLVDCFDTLRELNGSGNIIKGLKETLTESEALLKKVKDERDLFREEIGKLEKEVAGLQDERDLFKLELDDNEKKLKDTQEQIQSLQTRIIELGKSGILAEKIRALFQEQSPSPVTQPLPVLKIEKPEVEKVVPEKTTEKKSPIKENGLPDLPTVYAPMNTGVEFKKPFVAFLKSLYFGNKKTAKSVILTITSICQNGLDGVSNKKKTMDGPSNTGNSPANCVQVNVKKLRLSLKIQGDGVVFYELYYRKESVYGDRN